MTRELLQQVLAALVECRRRLQNQYPSTDIDDEIDALRDELAKPEQPAHTEAEVEVLLNIGNPHYSRKAQEKLIRRILGVPAP